jgi:tetratricopeptide (TPR) repeat protein
LGRYFLVARGLPGKREFSWSANVKPAVQRIFFLAILVALAGSAGSAQSPATSSNSRDTAFALEQQGSYTEAEAAWHSILSSQPANAEAYAHLGFLEARQEHYKQAVPFYRKALALDAAMPGLRLNLGLALFKGGELNEAIQTFTPLLKSQPATSAEAQKVTALLGIAHYGLGEYAAARPYLKTAAANDASNLQFRLMLAHSCLSLAQYQCVLDVYHEILTLNAESAEADMLAGEALDELHDHDGAIQQFRAAVKADPKEPTVHFGLGYLLWTQSKYEEAAGEFQAELVNVPDNAEAMAFLADAKMQLNDRDSALPLLEEAVRIDPRAERAHLDLGILYADAGRREDALREFKVAARLVPNDVSVHWRLARLYQAMGKKDEAKVEFDKTNSLHKATDATVLKQLHHAQERGKSEDAATPTSPSEK